MDLLPILISFLSYPKKEIQYYISTILLNFSKEEIGKLAIIENKGILPLIGNILFIINFT